jgi:hypothetical protein
VKVKLYIHGGIDYAKPHFLPPYALRVVATKLIDIIKF